MSKRRLLTILSAGVVVTAAMAQVPPKYKIVTIAGCPPDHYWAQVNNRGQIVFDIWQDGGNTDAIDIVLYDNGQYIRLTDDDVYDRQPDINDDGTIVWSRAVDGPGTPPQIVMWRDGELRQITNSAFDELSPRINNLGHVVWSHWKRGGCAGASADVYFYDGRTIHQITNDEDWSNQYVVINDDDWIAWTQFDFCQSPWDSVQMLYVDGVMTQVSPSDVYCLVGTTINNLGEVAWNFHDAYGRDGIQLWREGVVTTVTTWGGGPFLNNRGEITFWRYYQGPTPGSYEVWLYRNGEFLQLTSDPHNQGWNNIWSIPTDINDLGEVAIVSGRPWYYQKTVKLMKLQTYTGHPTQKGIPIRVERFHP